MRNFLTVFFASISFFSCFQNNSDQTKQQSYENSRRDFGLNDVSILLPAPKTQAEFSKMITAKDSGGKGTIFPLHLFQKFRPSKLMPPESQDTGIYPVLALVGMRVDPCGFDPQAKKACDRQIRLVMQPVNVNEGQGGSYITDFSFHLFYSLNEDEFRNFISDLAAFRDLSQVPLDSPLQVHPGIKAAGLESGLFDAFRSMLLPYLGIQSLTKFTFANIAHVDGIPDFAWSFGSVLLDGNNLSREPIPGVNSNDQTIVIKTGDNPVLGPINDFSVVESYLLDSNDSIQDRFVALFGSRSALIELEQPVFDKAIASTYRMENPKTHNIRNSDCVSCHIAAQTREFAAFQTQKPLASSSDQYLSNSGRQMNPTMPYPKEQRLIRAFGYVTMVEGNSAPLNSIPQIIPRTVFESDIVADYLNKNYPEAGMRKYPENTKGY